MEECHEKALARLMALLYLENADQAKYGSILRGLGNQFSLNQDQYPKTISHATNVLSNHKFDPKFYEAQKKSQEREKKNKEDKRSKDNEEFPGDSKRDQFRPVRRSLLLLWQEGP
jgi:hypothetical protein